MREGEPGETFVILVAGSADVRKGKRHIATLSAGDFAGEIALLTNAPANGHGPHYFPRDGTAGNTQGIHRSARRVPVHSAQSAKGTGKPNRTNSDLGCASGTPTARRARYPLGIAVTVPSPERPPLPLMRTRKALGHPDPLRGTMAMRPGRESPRMARGRAHRWRTPLTVFEPRRFSREVLRVVPVSCHRPVRPAVQVAR